MGSFHDAASGEEHAFVTGPNGVGMRDIGIGLPFGVNDIGQVVGYFYDAVAGEYHAFVTGPDGTGMTDLNMLARPPDGTILANAYDINNSGQIAVTGTIPEPATYAMMLAGLGIVSFMGRRTRLNRFRAVSRSGC
ncbi:putative secreted protein with PEP-CTERM sorting signal [Nitrosospira sp. Nsp2]|uniref:PEP-CTERM sorting domain-containing protein n=1 Tax=Nitrosospira sp. Nsp2 TaxID=136548 RepID=UPI000D4970C8|nr:PEP-CTERM sorting domain-containing protein [Nitrosospira sp. Nsp2]PTR16111.1 putative secreted protein with PEP-CTERM sorting signal [Nitrosospira sp. Nsp2]